MKDISIYFKPRELQYNELDESISSILISSTESHFPELEKNSIAIIECPEYRNSSQDNAKFDESKSFFESFLKLKIEDTWNFKLYDLGILLPGNEIKDTYFALSQVVSELIKHKVLPIIIGGSQDLTIALYQAYQNLELMVNLSCVDSSFDLGDPDKEISSNGYLSHIIMKSPCYLFNVSTIGIQAPYVKKSEMDLFEKLYFDTCRLGEFNADFKKAEPHLRNTDILSLDLNAIRISDFNSKFNTPNGFYADQICQISKYAGISDKLGVFALFNTVQNEINISNNQLISEILWYFIDGYSQRKGDFPVGSKKDYTKFIVNLDEHENELIFYKSPKSNRWWMEVPYPSSKGIKYERHQLVPCNYEDYQAAMHNEMPDLWWKTFQKLV